MLEVLILPPFPQCGISLFIYLSPLFYLVRMTLNDTVVYYISFQSCNTVDTDRHAIIQLDIRLLEKHEEVTFDIPVVILEKSLSFQQVRYNYIYQFLY